MAKPSVEPELPDEPMPRWVKVFGVVALALIAAFVVTHLLGGGLHHTPPEHTRPEHAPADHSPVDHTAPEHARPDHTPPEHTPPEHAAPHGPGRHGR